MAEGFTLVGSGCQNHDVTLSRDTDSVATQPGDILCIGAASTVFFGTTVTQSGATWTPIGFHQSSNGGSVLMLESTGGAGTGAITITEDNNNFADLCWAVVRPTDLANPSEAGANNSGSSNVDTMTVSLSGAKTRYLCYAHTHQDSITSWATDAGWTELLDENQGGAGGSHQIMYRLMSDTEVVVNPAPVNARMQAIVQGFDPVASGGTGNLINGGLINNGLINGGLIG